jgi:hypothetical protein
MAAREAIVWDLDRVAARFEEAASTAHRLPPVRVQGYFSLWPAIKREPREAYADEEPKRYRFPPDPAAIDRMVETMHWVGWLDEEQRHLVWMRAEGRGWRVISQRFGCDRTTAWRRWRKALGVVARRLNVPGLQQRRKAG